MNAAEKEKLLADCRRFEEPGDYEYPFIKVIVYITENHGFTYQIDYSYIINTYTDGRYFKYLTDYVKSIIDYYDSVEKISDFTVKIFNENR